MKAAYFREKGIHAVPQRFENRDYIVSFPTWGETLDALKNEMPSSGNVITTDYATIEDWSEVPNHPEIIDERINQIIDMTRQTEAVVYLGTPTSVTDPRTGNVQWCNSALTIHRGEIKSHADKTDLFRSEKEQLNMHVPSVDKRKVYMGSAAVICSELYAYAYPSDNPLRRQNPRQIIGLTNFAVPTVSAEVMQRRFNRAGGEDNFYRQSMEKFVGSYVLKYLPTVNRVIISDRGQPHLPPFNAVFDRVK